jgi:hypothetical protein
MDVVPSASWHPSAFHHEADVYPEEHVRTSTKAPSLFSFNPSRTRRRIVISDHTCYNRARFEYEMRS